MDNLTIISEYSPDSCTRGICSGDSSQGEGGKDFRSQRSKPNQLLSDCGVDGIVQSKKTLNQLKAQSQKKQIWKASKSIVAALEVITPGDAGALWGAVKNAGLVDDALSIETPIKMKRSI